LNQALGSLNEVVACFDVAFLNKYMNEGKHIEFLHKVPEKLREHILLKIAAVIPAIDWE